MSRAPPPEWVAEAPAVRAHLVISKGGEKRGEIDLSESPWVTFGRNSSLADQVLDHPSISRRHAGIGHGVDGKLYVVDLRATHGTAVNGERLGPNAKRELVEGDVVKFGASNRLYTVAVTKLEEGKGRTGAEDASASRATSRAQREREIAAAIESLRGPVAAVPSAPSNPAEEDREEEEEWPVGPLIPTSRTRQRPMDTGNGEGGGEESGDAVEEPRAKRMRLDGEAPMREDEENGDGGEEGDPWASSRMRGVPWSRQVALEAHPKTVMAVALDPSGARVMTGGMDGSVRFFDFGGMNESHQSFAQEEPEEGHIVQGIDVSSTGKYIAIAAGSSRVAVYDRDAKLVLRTVRGDPYLKDLQHTRGHVAMVAGVHWHPTEPTMMLSAGEDGSVRLWDVESGKHFFEELVNDTVIRVKNQKGLRAPCTAACFSPDGLSVANAVDDGTLQLWHLGSNFTRPALQVRDAHSDRITCLSFKPADKHIFASRSLDGTVKLWDLRRFRKPLATFEGLLSLAASANVDWSPIGDLLIAGSTVRKGSNEGGVVRIFDVQEARKSKGDVVDPLFERSLPSGVGAVCVRWHPGINQLFVGCTDGATRVFFDPEISEKGALLSTAKPAKARAGMAGTQNVDIANLPVYNPNALPMFRNKEEALGRKSFTRLRHDAAASARPEPPLEGKGSGGRVDVTKLTFAQQVAQERLAGYDYKEEDPREAVLRFAERAEKEGIYTRRAYARTQPKTLLDETTLEEEAEEGEGGGEGGPAKGGGARGR